MEWSVSEALQIIRDPNPGGPAKTYESSGSGTLIERHGVKTPTLLCYLPYFSSVNEDDVCPPSYTVLTFSHHHVSQSKEKCSQNLVWMYSKLNCTRNANLFLIFRRKNERKSRHREWGCLSAASVSLSGMRCSFPRRFKYCHVRIVCCILGGTRRPVQSRPCIVCYGYNWGPPVGRGVAAPPLSSSPTLSPNWF